MTRSIAVQNQAGRSRRSSAASATPRAPAPPAVNPAPRAPMNAVPKPVPPTVSVEIDVEGDSDSEYETDTDAEPEVCHPRHPSHKVTLRLQLTSLGILPLTRPYNPHAHSRWPFLQPTRECRRHHHNPPSPPPLLHHPLRALRPPPSPRAPLPLPPTPPNPRAPPPGRRTEPSRALGRRRRRASAAPRPAHREPAYLVQQPHLVRLVDGDCGHRNVHTVSGGPGA